MHFYLGIIIFLLTFYLIISERIHGAWAALLGGLAMRFFLVIELCVLSFIVANTAIQLFYVVLTENSLIVRNPVYRFWHAEFKFNTIEKLKSVIRADYRGLIFRWWRRRRNHGVMWPIWSMNEIIRI